MICVDKGLDLETVKEKLIECGPPGVKDKEQKVHLKLRMGYIFLTFVLSSRKKNRNKQPEDAEI